MRHAAFFLTFLFLAAPAGAQDYDYAVPEDEDCMMCHDDRSLIVEENGRRVAMWVSYPSHLRSVHGEEGCTSCHWDVDVDDLPHDDELEPVDCSMCHDDAVEMYEESLHGVALNRGRYLAPTCLTCHGKHNILASDNEYAKTYVSNIPELCGTCHKEGTTVSELRTMSAHHILEDYSQSIHGDGLFNRGLIVTAVCTSCHTSHDVRTHEDRRSSIHRANIATTCMQCHRQIEKVHVKVVNGRLWEVAPHQLPNCVDCHQPHNARRVFYEDSFPDSECIACHENPDLHKVTADGDTLSLFVDLDEMRGSAHATNQCVKCHTDVARNRDPICVDSGPVDCSMCHAEAVDIFDSSVHGQLASEGDERAPTCTTCHGDHDTLLKEDANSTVFRRNLPQLCGDCHESGSVADSTHASDGTHVLTNYAGSIHGKGLTESGLMVTATCVDCHTAHGELPMSDSLSTVHPSNVAETCATCHHGIYEQFESSIHSPLVSDTDERLPVCNDCHSSHTIKGTEQGDFRQEILNQCGDCHEDVTESYFETFHGKVSQLGSEATAKCSDCHGAHNILPTTHAASLLSRENVIETCATCHPQSNRKFVGYLTHATHHDRDKYPYLYYTFWFMTTLLVGVFSFFGLHTALWLPRALKERREKDRAKRQRNNPTAQKPAPEDHG